MSVLEIVFSPTGGTQKVADALAEALGGPAAFVDLSEARFAAPTVPIGDQDTAVIAVPAFGGRVPRTAIERLSLVEGNGAQAVLVAVYGNRAFEDTLVELEDAAVAAGFRPVAGIAAIAEHSIARQYAAGRPDAQDVGDLQGFAARILEKIAAEKDGTAPAAPSIPGNRPYKKASGAGLVPKADGSCNGCGTCAARCPVGAIDPANPRRTDAKRCISCMRCIQVCPQHARAVSSVMLFAAGTALKKACAERKPNVLFL